MPNTPDVRLAVDGTLYGGWEVMRIQRSIEQIAGKFDLSVTERWSGQDTPRPIVPGEECQVLVDGEPVITGYVDDVEVSYDANQHTVAVSGRDRTGDLVDCSAAVKTGNKFFTRPLLELVQRLCKPFGIEVSTDTDAGGPFRQFSWNPGDSVFSVIENAARIRAVLLVSDGVGGLLITRASKDRIDATIELGKNALACSGQFSHKDRYSEYTVLGQQAAADDGIFAGDAAHPKGVTKDERIKRYRPLIVLSEKDIDFAKAKTRAEWERNVRFGRSQRINYTVQGWNYAPGELWPINRLVTVRDSYLGLDTDRLIAGVTLTLDTNGLRTELSLTPREAFDLIPLPEDDDNWWKV